MDTSNAALHINHQVRHPHIIVLKEVFETPDSVIFIMELYVVNGDDITERCTNLIKY